MRYTRSMKSILLSILVLAINSSNAIESRDSRALNSLTVRSDAKNNMARETLKIDADSFYDIKFDYETFSGRVTDRDATSSIVKISSENKNTKFFRAGDLVEFKIQNSSADSEYCQGFVRSLEPDYFVMYAKDLFPCFPKGEYFRRGTVLIMHSEKLGQRVREASVYRASLLNKKRDFMAQLNGINNGIWNFEERKVKMAADYDRRIAEMEKEKLRALDELLTSKNDEIKLQRELAYRLDNVDKELDFYRIEKHELMFDRWHMDKDLGYPVYDKPEEIRPTRASGEKVVD